MSIIKSNVDAVTKRMTKNFSYFYIYTIFFLAYPRIRLGSSGEEGSVYQLMLNYKSQQILESSVA